MQALGHFVHYFVYDATLENWIVLILFIIYGVGFVILPALLFSTLLGLFIPPPALPRPTMDTWYPGARLFLWPLFLVWLLPYYLRIYGYRLACGPQKWEEWKQKRDFKLVIPPDLVTPALAKFETIYEARHGKRETWDDLRNGVYEVAVNLYRQEVDTPHPELVADACDKGLAAIYKQCPSIKPGGALLVHLSAIPQFHGCWLHLKDPFTPAFPNLIPETQRCFSIFEKMNAVQVPIGLPEEKWLEHISIWGGQGKGKTSLIQALIADRLQEVEAGRASLFIMDSQGLGPDELITSITSLKQFGPGGSLEGKLIFVKPSLQNPIAMNPFQMGKARQKGYTGEEQERLKNKTIELLGAVFGGKQGATFSQYQDIMYNFCIELMLEIPGAKLSTLHRLLTTKDKTLAEFRPHISRLSQAAQTFFYDQIDDSNFKERRKELAGRLAGVLQKSSLAAMLNAEECLLDFYTELATPKVIVVSTDKDYLGADLCMLYGRFMISLLLRAAQERAGLPRSQRLNVYCFLDEAHDYISNDTNIHLFIGQMRKMNYSLLCASQSISDIENPKVLDALLRTHTIFASFFTDGDARKVAPNMRLQGDDYRVLLNQPKFNFALYVDGWHRPITVYPPPILKNMPKMHPQTAEELLSNIAKKYSSSKPYTELPPPLVEDADPPTDPE